MSSVDNILRRVVRGESDGGWVLEVVMIIGRARDASRPCAIEVGGEELRGPLGEVVRERRIAGVEREAAFWSAAARSFSCIMLVSNDRRDTRFGLESTRENISRSLTLDDMLWSSSSSQSSSTSSSSIALLDCSSSSSESSKTAESS